MSGKIQKKNYTSLEYLELIAHFRTYGNVKFEVMNDFKQVYQTWFPETFNRLELEYELNNGNRKLKTLQVNKNNMLVLKNKIENNKVKITEL